MAKKSIKNLLGEMQKDRSRRPKGNQPQGEEEDLLNNPCLVKNRPNVSFDEVAGNSEMLKELKEIVLSIQQPGSYKSFGATLPRGILMTGGPGLGKTYTTQALATELDAPFYHVRTNDVVSKWFGESEKNLQYVFNHARRYTSGQIDIDPKTGEGSMWDSAAWAEKREAELLMADNLLSRASHPSQQNQDTQAVRERRQAIREQVRTELVAEKESRKNRKAVIFFDEIDALGADRATTPFAGGVTQRIVSVLLENMDGLESDKGELIIVAATNREDAMDPALRRAGRFDRIIRVKKPGETVRADIFKIHIGKAHRKADREFFQVDYDKIAAATKGMSGADISEIVRKACQDQAKKHREAPEAEKGLFTLVDTKFLLSVIEAHKGRKKDGEKKDFGFSPVTDDTPEKDMDNEPRPAKVPDRTIEEEI